MRLFVAALFSLLLLNCTSSEPDFTSLPDGVQTVSLLGDTLQTSSNTLPETLTTRIDSLIQVSDEINELIWRARLLGYNGEYRNAIELLSDAIAKKPEEPALYRHRGHRYISLRALDYAIQDFEKAVELIKGTEDIVEQDGLPNTQNKPTSSLHTNIWYHLGLAYYLTGDFEKAQNAYNECIKASTNNDMLVAALYWYYMSLRRNGQDEFAGQIIEPIETDMDIIENNSYHKLLLVFKGEFDPEMLLDEDSDALSNATVGYGIGNWHFINGRKGRAYSIWEEVYKGSNWASFGYIASEAELAQK